MQAWSGEAVDGEDGVVLSYQFCASGYLELTPAGGGGDSQIILVVGTLVKCAAAT